MGIPDAVASLISTGVNAYTANQANKANLKIANDQLAFNRDLALHGTTYKAQDMKNAGLHPTLAAGAPPVQMPGPVSADQKPIDLSRDASNIIASAQLDLQKKATESQIHLNKALANKNQSEADVNNAELPPEGTPQGTNWTNKLNFKWLDYGIAQKNADAAMHNADANMMRSVSESTRNKILNELTVIQTKLADTQELYTLAQIMEIKAELDYITRSGGQFKMPFRDTMAQEIDAALKNIFHTDAAGVKPAAAAISALLKLFLGGRGSTSYNIYR